MCVVVLTGRLSAVVTGHSQVFAHQIVTEGGRDPGVTAVTAVAFETGRYMCSRCLPGRD